MAALHKILGMMVAQTTSPATLGRTPEPVGVTDAEDNVAQYDRVMTTKLAIAYAGGLEAVHRARTETERDGRAGAAVDLCSGPGHYSLCLAKYLGYESVTGVDLSPNMVEVANGNAARQGLDATARFEVGDVRRLDRLAADSFDLASFTDAAHHMPDLAAVGDVLGEMDRLTKPTGLVMVMDLVRLRTAALTERYVNTLGHDYVERGLPRFFDDFRNSMYAAWTADELRGAIPRDTDRRWVHLTPRGLPTVQMIFGLPVGREQLFVRKGFPWTEADHPVAPGMRWEWRMMRRTLFWGSRAVIAPCRAAVPV